MNYEAPEVEILKIIANSDIVTLSGSLSGDDDEDIDFDSMT